MLTSFVFAQPPTLPTQFTGLIEINDGTKNSRGGIFYNGDTKKNHIVEFEGQNKNTSYLFRGDLVRKNITVFNY